jgi:GNAT superfamily N-acetyltransferase
MIIRQGTNEDLPELVALSLLAWEPVFVSFRHVLGPAIYDRIYPDWRRQQQETVETYCSARPNTLLYVAEIDGHPVGFVVYELNDAEKAGEVQLLAVHPNHQNGGIGTALNEFALARMREGGMQIAIVGTGGDPGHAPARRCYKKAGYTPLPLVRYYQVL